MQLAGPCEAIQAEASPASPSCEEGDHLMTTTPEPTPRRSTKKKDQAPRGVFRHRSGVWAVRFFCGAGHRHQERVGTIKNEAIRVCYERRARVHDKPGWCP